MQGTGVHSGYELATLDEQEDKILNKVATEQLLMKLTSKERTTIVMWAERYTLAEIARHISTVYEGRDEDNLLSLRAIGARIRKIIKKLRKLT